ncbi:MAG TPA: O-antigen ligase family protein [Ignavibacteriaceae bacterium]|nr:O-antigen ligase family protein [Ignavibacteriaceae bacterium]
MIHKTDDDSISTKFLIGFFIFFFVLIIFSLKWVKPILNEGHVLNKYGFNIYKILVVFLVYQLLQALLLLNVTALATFPRYFFFFNLIIVGTIIAFRIPDKALMFMEKISIKWTYVFVILYTISFIKNPTIGLFREIREHILFLNAIEDGGFFSVFFPFFLYSDLNRNIKYFFIFMFVLLLILINGTQATILAVFITFTIYLSYGFKKRKKSLQVLFVLAFLSISIVFFSDVLYDYDTGLSWSGVQQTYQGMYAGSIGVRMGNIWVPMTLHVINKSPVIGFGNGSWRIQSEKHGFESGNKRYFVFSRSPHNIFLVYFVDWGLIGLAIMVVLFYNAIKSNYKLLTNERISVKIRRYAEGYLCGWISFLSWGFTGNAHNWLGWSVICFLLIGTITLKYYSEESFN